MSVRQNNILQHAKRVSYLCVVLFKAAAAVDIKNNQFKTIMHFLRRSHAPRGCPHSAQRLDRSSREELHRSMAVHEWLHIGSDQMSDTLLSPRNSDVQRSITSKSNKQH